MSTSAIWCHIVRSCNFHPCNMVPRCPFSPWQSTQIWWSRDFSHP